MWIQGIFSKNSSNPCLRMDSRERRVEPGRPDWGIMQSSSMWEMMAAQNRVVSGQNLNMFKGKPTGFTDGLLQRMGEGESTVGLAGKMVLPLTELMKAVGEAGLRNGVGIQFWSSWDWDLSWISKWGCWAANWYIPGVYMKRHVEIWTGGRHLGIVSLWIVLKAKRF